MCDALFWRSVAESNRSARFCRPLPNLSANRPFGFCDAKINTFSLTSKINPEIISHNFINNYICTNKTLQRVCVNIF